MPERPNKSVVLNGAGDRPDGAAPAAVPFEDAALVGRVQQGDMDAFGMLVAKYQDRVYNTCWRMCGHAEDARDLTQEAFFRAYQSLARFQGRSGFYTWLFRIAVNLTLSHRRKARLRLAESLDQNGPAGAPGTPLRHRIADDSAAQPVERAVASETHERIERALEELDPDQRVVIVLRDVEGFDYAEIARILEVAPGTVKSRLHRARAALRERLGST